MAITIARREAAKLRLGLQGTSGSGKTYTSLLIAAVLGKNIGVIDSEKKSVKLYQGRPGLPEFSIDDEFEAIESPSVHDYIKSIARFAAAGIDVLIIDSLSHSWQAALEAVDRGGGWIKAGKTVSPALAKLINTILTYPGHVICTMRSQTKYEISKDEKTGKAGMQKIGLAPQVRADTEYEFTVVVDLERSGAATVMKSRCGDALPMDEVYQRTDLPERMRRVKAWLADGAVSARTEGMQRIKFASDDATLKLAGAYIKEQKEAGALTPEELASLQDAYRVRKTELADEEVPV